MREGRVKPALYSTRNFCSTYYLYASVAFFLAAYHL
jgi:hypothetical protein